MVGTQLHSGVDTGDVRNALHLDEGGLIDHGNQDAVDDEAGSLVDRMKLIEVIAGVNTPAETVETIKKISTEIGKSPVQVNEAAGFVVNRILIPMINEAAFIKMEGVSNIAGIDTAMKLGANHPMGPLELGDFIGLDICLAIMDVLYKETGDSKYRACPLIRKMVRGGNLGCKSGKGFYVYNADRTKTPVDEL